MALYRLFLTLGGLLVVALFAALLVPYFIDWTAYKQAFEREASRIVGQPVTVKGEAKIRLLPLPRVTFGDLSIGRYEDGSPMMTIAAFSMAAELFPFLRGEIRIVEMVLERPDLSVRVNENGSVDWTARKEMLLDPDRITIERMSVKDARLRIDGIAGGRQIVGQSVDAEISAQSLSGPWRIQADGLIDGVASRFEITTGRLQPDTRIRVRASVTRSDQPYRLVMDGPVSIADNLLSWQGEFDLAAAPTGSFAEPLPVHAAGLFLATPNRVESSEYRLEIGNREDPYTITGAAWVDLRERIFFHVDADGRQIDFRRLEGEEQAAATGIGIEQRLAVLREMVNRIPIPNAAGVIFLKLPAIVAGDTVVREVSSVVRPDINGWRIDSFSAVLPGNTTVEAKGKLGTGDDFGFTGELVLASRQPTGFATWLSGRSSAPLRRLRSAGMAANVTLTGHQWTFEELELALDDVTLTGRLQRLAPVSGRAAIIADLAGQEIDIDDLRAIFALMQDEEESEDLSNHDLDVRLRAGLLKGAGLHIGDVDGHIRMEGGEFSVERLNAGDFYGAAITTSGNLSDVLGTPEGRFDMHVEAADASRLARFALERLGENAMLSGLLSAPELAANLRLDIRLDAHPLQQGSRGAIVASGEIGGTQITLRDRFEGELANWRAAHHEATVKLEQEAPWVLARQLGFDVAPLPVAGPLVISADLSGKPADGLSAALSVSAPDTDLAARGVITPAEESALVNLLSDADFSLDVTLGSADFVPWLQFAGLPLPLWDEVAPLSLAMSASRGEREYDLRDIDGQISGANFSGTLRFRQPPAGRPRVEGELRLDRLDLPLLAGLSLGNVAEELAEEAGPFRTPAFAGYDGDLAIEAQTAETGLEEAAARDFRGKLRAVDGVISLPEFAFDWLGGHIEGDVELKNLDGSVLVNSRLRAKDLDVARLMPIAGFAPSIAGRSNINLTVQGSGRNWRSLIAGLSGSGVVTARQARIAGITTAGLPTILARSEAEDFELGRESAEELASATMLGGSFAAEEISSPFSIHRSRIMLRNINLNDGRGQLILSADHDLASGETEISGTISLDAGDEERSGAEPEAAFTWRGQPGAMAVSIDATSLQSFLSLRAFEREQRRVEMLQAKVLENQRIRRDLIEANARIDRRKAEEERRVRQLQEIQRQLQEEKSAEQEEESEPEQEALAASQAAPHVQTPAVPTERVEGTSSGQRPLIFDFRNLFNP